MLSDPGVSRQHARIVRAGETYYVEDLGSANGTLLDGRRVTREALADGARITVGASVLVFRHAGGRLDDLSTSLQIDARDRATVIREPPEQDIRALKRAKADLAALYRAGQVISSVLDTEALYRSTVDTVLDVMPKVDACSVHRWDEAQDTLACKGQRTREPGGPAGKPLFSQAILKSVLQERRAMLITNTQQDERFRGSESIQSLRIQSAMCVPLQSRDRLYGLLQADVFSAARALDEDDLRLLAAIGMQAGSALEIAILFDQLAAEKSSLQEAHERLRNAQETLIRSEKLAAVGRLSAGIVHDVKNPMTVILCHAETLQMALTNAAKKTIDTASVVDGLKEIEEGVLHCNTIINGLLQFAKQAKPEKTVVDLNTISSDIVRFLAHEIVKAKAAMTTSLKPDLPPVLADGGQIKQVMLNIIMNGLQALGENGGTMEIATGVEGAGPGGKVFVRIRDSGCGMSAEAKSHLFEPFFTSKTLGEGAGGMGLGLSISYGIIENHGGTIEVESEVGRGSTFTIKLPVHAAGAGASGGAS